MNEEKKYEETRLIVIENITRISEDAILHIGGHGAFTRDELLVELEKETEVGKTMVADELEYLQMLKEE